MNSPPNKGMKGPKDGKFRRHMLRIQEIYHKSMGRNTTSDLTGMSPYLLMADNNTHPSLPLYQPQPDSLNPLKWLSQLTRSYHYCTIQSTLLTMISSFQNERYNKESLSRSVRSLLKSDKIKGPTGKSKHRTLIDAPNMLLEELKYFILAWSNQSLEENHLEIRNRLEMLKNYSIEGPYKRKSFMMLLNKIASILSQQLIVIKKQEILVETNQKLIQVEHHAKSILSHSVLFLLYIYRNTRNTPLFLSTLDIDTIRSANYTYNNYNNSAGLTTSSSTNNKNSNNNNKLNTEYTETSQSHSTNINIRTSTTIDIMVEPNISTLANGIVPAFDLTRNIEKLKAVLTTITGQCLHYLVKTPEFIKIFPIIYRPPAAAVHDTVHNHNNNIDGSSFNTNIEQDAKNHGSNRDLNNNTEIEINLENYTDDMYVNPFINIDGTPMLPGSILHDSSINNLSQFNFASNMSYIEDETISNSQRARFLRNHSMIKWFETGILNYFQSDRRLMASFMQLHGLLFELARITSGFILARQASNNDFSQVPCTDKMDYNKSSHNNYYYWEKRTGANSNRYFQHNISDLLSYKLSNIQLNNLIKMCEGLTMSIQTTIKYLLDAAEQHKNNILNRDNGELGSSTSTYTNNELRALIEATIEDNIWLPYYHCSSSLADRILKDIQKLSNSTVTINEAIKKYKQVSTSKPSNLAMDFSELDEENQHSGDEDGEDTGDLELNPPSSPTNTGISKETKQQNNKDNNEGDSDESGDDDENNNKKSNKNKGSDDEKEEEYSDDEGLLFGNNANSTIAQEGTYKFIAKMQQLTETINFYLPPEFRADLIKTHQPQRNTTAIPLTNLTTSQLISLGHNPSLNHSSHTNNNAGTTNIFSAINSKDKDKPNSSPSSGPVFNPFEAALNQLSLLEIKPSGNSKEKQHQLVSSHKAIHHSNHSNNNTQQHQFEMQYGKKKGKLFIPHFVYWLLGSGEVNRGEWSLGRSHFIQALARQYDNTKYALAIGGTAKAKQLQELSIWSSEIDINADAVIDLLANQIRSNPLFRIELGDNHLNAKSIKILTSVFLSCSGLVDLILTRNDLGDEGAGYIADIMVKHPSMRLLDLSNNNIAENGAFRLSEALEHNQTVTALDISNNPIGEEGAVVIAKSLNRNHFTRVQHLIMNQINTTADTSVALISMLKFHPTLVKLILDSALEPEQIASDTGQVRSSAIFGHGIRPHRGGSAASGYAAAANNNSNNNTTTNTNKKKEGKDNQLNPFDEEDEFPTKGSMMTFRSSITSNIGSRSSILVGTKKSQAAEFKLIDPKNNAERDQIRAIQNAYTEFIGQLPPALHIIIGNQSKETTDKKGKLGKPANKKQTIASEFTLNLAPVPTLADLDKPKPNLKSPINTNNSKPHNSNHNSRSNTVSDEDSDGKQNSNRYPYVSWSPLNLNSNKRQVENFNVDTLLSYRWMCAIHSQAHQPFFQRTAEVMLFHILQYQNVTFNKYRLDIMTAVEKAVLNEEKEATENRNFNPFDSKASVLAQVSTTSGKSKARGSLINNGVSPALVANYSGGTLASKTAVDVSNLSPTEQISSHARRQSIYSCVMKLFPFDPSHLFCEEFKLWLIQWGSKQLIYNETEPVITFVTKKLNYVKSIKTSQSFTVNQPFTLLLANLERLLISTVSHLNRAIRQLNIQREVKMLECNTRNMLFNSVIFLYFVMRNTKKTPVVLQYGLDSLRFSPHQRTSINMKNMVSPSSSVAIIKHSGLRGMSGLKAFSNSISGEILIQLIESPYYRHLFPSNYQSMATLMAREQKKLAQRLEKEKKENANSSSTNQNTHVIVNTLSDAKQNLVPVGENLDPLNDSMQNPFLAWGGNTILPPVEVRATGELAHSLSHTWSGLHAAFHTHPLLMDHFLRCHGLLLELAETTCVLPLSQSIARGPDMLTCQPALVQLQNLLSLHNAVRSGIDHSVKLMMYCARAFDKTDRIPTTLPEQYIDENDKMKFPSLFDGSYTGLPNKQDIEGSKDKRFMDIVRSGAREKRDMKRWRVNHAASLFCFNALKENAAAVQADITAILNDLTALLNASKKHSFMEEALASADCPPTVETLKFISRVESLFHINEYVPKKYIAILTTTSVTAPSVASVDTEDIEHEIIVRHRDYENSKTTGKSRADIGFDIYSQTRAGIMGAAESTHDWNKSRLTRSRGYANTNIPNNHSVRVPGRQCTVTELRRYQLYKEREQANKSTSPSLSPSISAVSPNSLQLSSPKFTPLSPTLKSSNNSNLLADTAERRIAKEYAEQAANNLKHGEAEEATRLYALAIELDPLTPEYCKRLAEAATSRSKHQKISREPKEKLKESEISDIADEMRDHPVEIVELVQNCITPKLCLIFSQAVDECPSLTKLDLTRNDIGDEGIKSLAKVLSNHPHLEHLDVKQNNITGKGATYLSEALRTNSVLTFLDMSYNLIGDEGVSAISNAIQYNYESILSDLRLSGVNCSDRGADKILIMLAFNTSIFSLALNDNDDVESDLLTSIMDNVKRKCALLAFVTQNLEKRQNQLQAVRRNILRSKKVAEYCTEANQLWLQYVQNPGTIQYVSSYNESNSVDDEKEHLGLSHEIAPFEITLYVHLNVFPLMASKLLKLLDEDDSALRTVYDSVGSLVNLCLLRADKLVSEHQLQLHEEAPVDFGTATEMALSSTVKRGKNLGQDTTSAASRKLFAEDIERQLAEWLTVLTHVTTAIRTRLWENLRDSFLLAVDDPETLKQTLSIVQAEDEINPSKQGQKMKLLDDLYMARTWTKIPSLAIEKPQVTTSLAKSLYDEIDLSINERFDDVMARAEGKSKDNKQEKEKDEIIIGSLDDFLGEEKKPSAKDNTRNINNKNNENKTKEEQKTTPVIAKPKRDLNFMLDEMKLLVEDLILIKNDVEPCFPSSFQIFTFYFSRYHSRLVAMLTEEFDISQMTIGEILSTVHFINWYTSESLKWHEGISDIETELDTYLDNFMDAYVVRTKEKMIPMILNILKQDHSSIPEKLDDGYTVTQGPQDLFSYMNKTIDMAMKNYEFSGQTLVRLGQMICDIIKHYLSEQLDWMKNAQKTLEKLSYQEQKEAAPSKSNKNNDNNYNETYLTDPLNYFLAQINNCSLYESHANGMLEVLLGDIVDEFHQEKLTTSIEKLTPIYGELAELSMSILTNYTIAKLTKDNMNKLFTMDWYNHPDQTTDDFRKNLSRYLALYAKNIRQDKHSSQDNYAVRFFLILSRDTCIQYVNLFLNSKLIDQSNIDLSVVGEYLTNDRSAILDTLIEFEDLITKKYIERFSDLLSCIEEILTGDPDFMSVHYTNIIERFSRTNNKLPVLYLLTGLMKWRKDLSENQRTTVINEFKLICPKELLIEKKPNLVELSGEQKKDKECLIM